MVLKERKYSMNRLLQCMPADASTLLNRIIILSFTCSFDGFKGQIVSQLSRTNRQI